MVGFSLCAKKGDVITLTTDKQVYNPGENVK